MDTQAGTELTDGVWYPVGGFGRVVAGLRAAAEACGARVRCGAAVARLDVRGGRVRGAVLRSGEHLHADIVVANRCMPP